MSFLWFILWHIPASGCALAGLSLGVSFPGALAPLQELLGIDALAVVKIPAST